MLMLIDFNHIPEVKVAGMSNGTGEMSAKMYAYMDWKIIPCCIHKGGSIGIHPHTTSDDINYVLSGFGKAVCDGKEEILQAGTCHVCPRGSEHSIENCGEEDLVLLTIVIEE